MRARRSSSGLRAAARRYCSYFYSDTRSSEVSRYTLRYISKYLVLLLLEIEIGPLFNPRKMALTHWLSVRSVLYQMSYIYV